MIQNVYHVFYECHICEQLRIKYFYQYWSRERNIFRFYAILKRKDIAAIYQGSKYLYEAFSLEKS